ncbi:Ribonuclease H-like domain containing protein [Melia azedarach]|uniref:Ribonuclease H-like domain containing protein n=1 Tax=Melia azedarach TaxID=155640 RepID=A0ACC1XPA4_MELAZ|nr:Ribonuclease H-like domain containing protein [Melia azedarach]
MSMWIPPPDKWFKLNVDASIDEKKRLVGLGMVIRDSKGEIMAAAGKRTEFYGDVELAKVEAIRFGVQIATESGLVPMIIESDSMNAVMLVKGKTSSIKEIYWVISDIQMLISQKANFDVCYIPRIYNSATHNMTKIATGY